MIDRALLLLRDELQSYMNFHDASVNVVIDNIGLFETSKGDTLTNNIIITLVNIEEESTLKNKPALVRPFNTVGIYQNPPVFLNLYVLLTCNYSGPDYPLALRRLSFIIRFLQSKSSFAASSSVTGGGLDLDEDGIRRQRGGHRPHLPRPPNHDRSHPRSRQGRRRLDDAGVTAPQGGRF